MLRLAPGLYDIDSHEVEVEWQHHPEVGRPGHLVVVDGPLRQPFADYLAMSEANAEYDTHSIAKTSALHHVPKERRMTFDDTHKKYTRLEAMKVAKEQAAIREKAADYSKEGRQVPDELVRKYNKVLRQKLRSGRGGGCVPGSEERPAEESPTVRTEQQVDTVRSAEATPAPHTSAPAALVGQAGVACWMAHRGISLNGMPSFMPAPVQAGAAPPQQRGSAAHQWQQAHPPAERQEASRHPRPVPAYVQHPQQAQLQQPHSPRRPQERHQAQPQQPYAQQHHYESHQTVRCAHRPG